MHDLKLLPLFEEFLNSIDDQIKIGNHINQLTGNGTEYLVINDIVVAKFYNGNIIAQTLVNANEVTKPAILGS